MERTPQSFCIQGALLEVVDGAYLERANQLYRGDDGQDHRGWGDGRLGIQYSKLRHTSCLFMYGQ